MTDGTKSDKIQEITQNVPKEYVRLRKLVQFTIGAFFWLEIVISVVWQGASKEGPWVRRQGEPGPEMKRT